MRKSCLYLLIIAVILFCSCFIGIGQNSYNFSKQLIKYQSKDLSDSEIENINSKINKTYRSLDTTKVIELLIDKGIILQLLSNYKESQNSFYEAIVLSNEMNNLNLKGNCFLGLSNFYYRLANNYKSLEYCIQAEELFTEINDTLNLITASLLMGQVLTDLRDFDGANQIYKNILLQAEQRNDSVTLAEIYNHRGATSTFQEDYYKAIFYYNESLKINSALGNNINIGINYANIGEAYMFLGDIQKAKENLFLALNIEQKANFISSIAFIYYTLAQTFSLENNNEKATEYFNKSLEILNLTGEIKQKPILYFLLSEHYFKNNDYKNALYSYKKYVAVRDSLGDISNKIYISELKIKYNVDKQEKELRLMINEKKIQEEKIKSDEKRIKLQNIIIFLVVIILILAFGFIFYFIKNQKKLEEAIQTKDVLFSIIGHDLRGPMGTIKQIVNALSDCKNEDKDRFIKLLKKPTENTFELLEDLLSWSKSLNENLSTINENVFIHDLVNNVFEVLAPIVNEKQIVFSNLIPQEVMVKADKNQLSAIIRNLASNAIKYSYVGERVEIYHEIENKRVKIFVKDNGVGIEPQNIKKILSTNQFFTTYGTQNEKGSGFGLMLSKNFIQKLGGKLEVFSDVGKGSTFCFSVPYVKKTVNDNHI